MAKCKACGREMTNPAQQGCISTQAVLEGGLAIPRVPFGKEVRHNQEPDLRGMPPEQAEKYLAEWRFLQEKLGPWPGNLTRCPGCRTPLGKPHHPGCDDEECSRCARQAISCDCHPGDGRKPPFPTGRAASRTRGPRSPERP